MSPGLNAFQGLNTFQRLNTFPRRIACPDETRRAAGNARAVTGVDAYGHEEER